MSRRRSPSRTMLEDLIRATERRISDLGIDLDRGGRRTPEETRRELAAEGAHLADLRRRLEAL